MSRYVQPASNAAWKIGGLKRGSTAFRIASTRSARASSAIEAASDASTAAPAKRGSPVRSAAACARDASTSASTNRSKKSRRWATAAAAAPTPPAPITRTRIRRNLPCDRFRRGRDEGGGRLPAHRGLRSPAAPWRRRGRVRRLGDRRRRERVPPVDLARAHGRLGSRRAGSRPARTTRSRAGRPTATGSRSSRSERRREGAPPALRAAGRRRRAGVPHRPEGGRRRAGLVARRDPDRLLGARAGRGVRRGGREEARTAAVQAAPVQARQRRLDGRPAPPPLRRPGRRLEPRRSRSPSATSRTRARRGRPTARASRSPPPAASTGTSR